MKKVLYIDDDIDQLELYKMAFALYAPDVEFYAEKDPFMSIARICSLKPDLVLLDLVMAEGMGGLEVAKMIRENYEVGSVMIVAFTNSMLTNIIAPLNKLGITEIWEKIKMNPKMMVMKVKNLLDK